MDLTKEGIVAYINNRLQTISNIKNKNKKIVVAVEMFTYFNIYFNHIEEKIGQKFLKDAVMNKAIEFLSTDHSSSQLNELSISLIQKINLVGKPQPVG
jgi:hypothetical protein